MLKLYKINISVKGVTETILQSVTLAICFIFTLQRYEKKSEYANIPS